MKYKANTRVTLWAVRLCLLALVALIFFAPRLVQWYADIRRMEEKLETVILTAFYVCVPAAGTALVAMDRLLSRFLRGDIFTAPNVRLIRLVSLCCAVVALATLFGGIGYPPLWFVTFLMVFLCLTVLVIAQIMEAATALREENDLTI